MVHQMTIKWVRLESWFPRYQLVMLNFSVREKMAEVGTILIGSIGNSQVFTGVYGHVLCLAHQLFIRTGELCLLKRTEAKITEAVDYDLVVKEYKNSKCISKPSYSHKTNWVYCFRKPSYAVPNPYPYPIPSPTAHVLPITAFVAKISILLA